MADRIEWKIPNLFKADATKCYEEIGHNGATAEEVLEKAKDVNSELHKCFEWDDSIASYKYRLEQARQVCRSLVVIHVNQPNKTQKRVFQVTSERKSEYRPVQFFATHEDEYEKLLGRAKSELINFQNRYKDIVELEEVNQAISNFLDS